MRGLILSSLFVGLFIFAISLVTAVYTAPTYTNVTIVLDASYTAPSYTNVTIVLGDEEPSPPPTDTCTPPAVNNNWVVSFPDNCTLSSNTNLGTGKLIVNGTAGRFILNANLTINGRIMTCTSSSCSFIQTTSGRLIFA
jgi:hypothetical protein